VLIAEEGLLKISPLQLLLHVTISMIPYDRIPSHLFKYHPTLVKKTPGRQTCVIGKEKSPRGIQRLLTYNTFGKNYIYNKIILFL